MLSSSRRERSTSSSSQTFSIATTAGADFLEAIAARRTRRRFRVRTPSIESVPSARRRPRSGTNTSGSAAWSPAASHRPRVRAHRDRDTRCVASSVAMRRPRGDRRHVGRGDEFDDAGAAIVQPHRHPVGRKQPARAIAEDLEARARGARRTKRRVRSRRPARASPAAGRLRAAAGRVRASAQCSSPTIGDLGAWRRGARRGHGRRATSSPRRPSVRPAGTSIAAGVPKPCGELGDVGEDVRRPLGPGAFGGGFGRVGRQPGLVVEIVESDGGRREQRLAARVRSGAARWPRPPATRSACSWSAGPDVRHADRGARRPGPGATGRSRRSRGGLYVTAAVAAGRQILWRRT